MKLFISTAFAAVGTLTTVLGGFPSWTHWVLGIATAILILGILARSVWRWFIATRGDAQVDAALAKTVCALAVRTELTPPTAAGRLAAAIVTLETLRSARRRW